MSIRYSCEEAAHYCNRCGAELCPDGYACFRDGEVRREVRLVRFDWAIKRLLRNKADFAVVNGFLSSLLGHEVKIVKTLESESNAASREERVNRVDVLVEDRDGVKYIIEVQTSTELDFFHRMVYSVSTVVADFLKRGAAYENVKKVYSVNILYFSLGQGEDYVYRGTTSFVGLHKGDTLKLSKTQKAKFALQEVGDIFPEYFVLRVNDFNDVSKTPLDEWLYFLKHSEVPEGFTAPGLEVARDNWDYYKMDTQERRAYDRYIENTRYENGVYEHWKMEGVWEGRAEGLVEGRAEGRTEGLAEGRTEGIEAGRKMVAQKLKAEGLPINVIARATGLDNEEIASL